MVKVSIYARRLISRKLLIFARKNLDTEIYFGDFGKLLFLEDFPSSPRLSRPPPDIPVLPPTGDGNCTVVSPRADLENINS